MGPPASQPIGRIRTRQVQPDQLCINKKDILGEANPNEKDAVDCIPLIGTDKDQVEKIAEDLNSLKSFPSVESILELRSNVDSMNELPKIKIENQTSKLANDNSAKIYQEPGIFPLDAVEGSGLEEDSILGSVLGALGINEEEEEQVDQTEVLHPKAQGAFVTTTPAKVKSSLTVDLVQNATKKPISPPTLSTTNLNINSAKPSISNATEKMFNNNDMVVPLDNETELHFIAFNPGFNVGKVPISAEAKHARFSKANTHLSSVVAGWAAGFFLTFTVFAISAMIVKNRNKNRKKLGKDEYILSKTDDYYEQKVIASGQSVTEEAM